MASNPCIAPVWLPMILAMIHLINLQYTMSPIQGPSVRCHSNNELSIINSKRNPACIEYITMLSNRAIAISNDLTLLKISFEDLYSVNCVTKWDNGVRSLRLGKASC
jgi:hypothetical protein